jgi:hypothetical protein
MMIFGSPPPELTSISTAKASTPKTAAEKTLASTRRRVAEGEEQVKRIEQEPKKECRTSSLINRVDYKRRKIKKFLALGHASWHPL